MYFITQLLQSNHYTPWIDSLLNSMFAAIGLLYRSCFNSSWMQVLLHRRKWKVTRCGEAYSLNVNTSYVVLCMRLPFHPHEKGTYDKLEFLGVLVYFLCPQGAYSPFKNWSSFHHPYSGQLLPSLY